jgi:apolipoprotein N-acyltransferase
LAPSENVVTHFQNKSNGILKKVLKQFLLLLLGSILFSLSFPNLLSKTGFFPLAFIALVPIFIVIHRSNWLGVFIYGALYGFITYSIINFWLTQFHPLAGIIVPVIYLSYFIIIFPLLKLADELFPDYGYILQIFIWISYEILRTKGFLGYAYGIIGYSQYIFLPLIRVASITGVWGVSFFVVFPSAFLGNALKSGKKSVKKFFRENRIIGIIYLILIVCSVIYGLFYKTDYSESPSHRVALIQHNVDPWKGGIPAFKKSLKLLKELSLEAMQQDPDIVIWSETAFVPAIAWHTAYRQNQDAYALVKELKDFLTTQPVPYILGNDDGQLGKDENGNLIRVDYNAALYFENGDFRGSYRKVHLVPFTENFPFKKLLPGIYQWLVDADTHFWEKGDTFNIFDIQNVKYGTPICFEDTFGYISREFVRNGAEIIANITNDSWSKSVVSETQHMAMAVFRAIENQRTVVRSTNGGITCAIDPSGKITAALEPFIEGYLVTDVPVYSEKTTFYTRYGDWFAYLMVILSAVGIIGGIFRWLLRRSKTDQ